MHAQPILIPPFNTAMRARKHTRKRVHTRACAHMRKSRRERVRSHALASCRDPAYANALVYTEVYMTDSQEKGLSLSFFLSLSLSLARSLARPPARSLCMCCARAPSFPPLLSPSPSSPTSLSQSRALSEHTARGFSLFLMPHPLCRAHPHSHARTRCTRACRARVCVHAHTHTKQRQMQTGEHPTRHRSLKYITGTSSLPRTGLYFSPRLFVSPALLAVSPPPFLPSFCCSLRPPLLSFSSRLRPLQYILFLSVSVSASIPLRCTHAHTQTHNALTHGRTWREGQADASERH